ncbi:MAG: large-conductance mechanosensitive channel [Vicingaceae bacterium]|jgi:large conductance mechanosensitive channel|nr:MAG: large-conductance mechanosensitive channel [Vicingaceae bacterium]
MGFLKEFKEFAFKGNLIDMAVGFVMGAAFTKLSGSFIKGMVMPLVGLLQGKDMSDWKWVVKQAQTDESGKIIAEEVSVKYGEFLSVLIEFLLVAFVMFLFVKAINAMRKKEEAKPASPPAPSKEELLLTEIRDLLKKNS